MQTWLRLIFSVLNKHRFRYAIDCVTPVCECGLASEDNEHFLLHCPQYCSFRLHLFGQISDNSEINLASIDDTSLCNLLYMEIPFVM